MSCLQPLWLVTDSGHLCAPPLRNSLGNKDPQPVTSKPGNEPQQVAQHKGSSNLSAHPPVPPVLYYLPGARSQQNRCSAKVITDSLQVSRLTPVPTPRPHMPTLCCKSNEYWHPSKRQKSPRYPSLSPRIALTRRNTRIRKLRKQPRWHHLHTGDLKFYTNTALAN